MRAGADRVFPATESATDQQRGYGRAAAQPLPAGKKSSINGIFLLCGVPEEGDCFASLTPGQQKDFQDIFQNPGEFMMIGGKMYADPDDVADTVYGLWDTLQDGETVVLTKWGGSGKRETA